MERYVIIDANGYLAVIKQAELMPLEQIQRHVGGYIEAVCVDWKGRNLDGFVNEDGLSLGLPRNKSFPSFVGPVVLGKVDEEGEFRGIDYGQNK